MKTAKQEVLELLDVLPEDTELETIMEMLHFKMQVLRGLQDVEDGRLVSHDDVVRRMGKWLKSPGQ